MVCNAQPPKGLGGYSLQAFLASFLIFLNNAILDTSVASNDTFNLRIIKLQSNPL